MGYLVCGLLVSCLALSGFAQSRKEYMEELNKARKEFMAQRDSLHDQNRILRINWHKERAALYAQLKNQPGDRAIQEKINAGAKKFLADKKEVYRQLRKDWLKTRQELKEKTPKAS